MGSLDYSHWRKFKSACFKCRKSWGDALLKCPNCHGEVHSMGTHFRAPKSGKIREWQAIEMLYAAGVRYEVVDGHYNGWSESYRTSGHKFESWQLWQVLAECGIGSDNPEDWQWERRMREWQWPGERPSKPRDVPQYVAAWRSRVVERIANVYEICEKLNWQKPAVDDTTLAEVQEFLQQRAEKRTTGTSIA